jgi:16S rRNA processing protein RimM
VSERLVPLGEIVTTHGIDGWLKLNPYNPQTTVLRPTREVCLEKNGKRSRRGIEHSRPYKDQFLIKLSDIDGIDDAVPWVGSILYLAERDLDPLAAGEYYHYQVVGLEVFDIAGERIGVVTGTWSTPGGELYIVKGTVREHLIPAVKEIIEKVDFAARKMVINPPTGLLDL